MTTACKFSPGVWPKWLLNGSTFRLFQPDTANSASHLHCCDQVMSGETQHLASGVQIKTRLHREGAENGWILLRGCIQPPQLPFCQSRREQATIQLVEDVAHGQFTVQDLCPQIGADNTNRLLWSSNNVIHIQKKQAEVATLQKSDNNSLLLCFVLFCVCLFGKTLLKECIFNASQLGLSTLMC